MRVLANQNEKTMTEQKRILIIKRLFGVVAIAVVWFVASVVLILMLAGANDTMDMKATVPLWMKISSAIALFPTNCFINLGQAPTGLSDRAAGALCFVLIFINSIFWGALWFFLFRRVARFLSIKKIGKLPA
jgi:hypothetical protein